MPRKYTNKLWEMVEEGTLSKASVLNCCLSYMSEADVRDMMHANEIYTHQEEDDDDE